MTQATIADSEIDIAAARALTLQACGDLDGGGRSAQSTTSGTDGARRARS